MRTLRSRDGDELGDAATVLSHSHQRVTRVSVLDDLFNPLPGLIFTGSDGYTIGGSVEMDTSRTVQRTCNLELANPDGVWTPSDPDSAFFWTRFIRVERGVRVGGVAFYAPLGVFLIDQPEVDSRRRVLKISGSDRVDRATRSEFTVPESFAAGTRVGTAIRSILEDAGVGNTRWSVDDDEKTLGTARHYEVGEARLSAAKSLATAFSLEVFADAEGFMVVQPKRDPDDAPVVWTFAPGEEATHVGLSKRWSRDRFYNHVLVTGENAEEEPVRGEALITDPSNPLRVTGPMGDRLFKLTSGMVTTTTQAEEAARSLLWERALIEEELSVQHVANPGLEIGDAVHITDDISATDDKYLVSSLTIPVAGGPAALNVKKVRRLN